MDEILDDLNEPQREAVLHGSGPLMVVAGAGSGKTRVITRRIARLLRDGVSSRAVLALTFTNKAAGEMSKRAEKLGGGRVLVATFHSACARFLRRDGHLLGLPRDYSIYDTYDRDSVVKMLLGERGHDRTGIKPAEVGRRISQLKNLGFTPQDVRDPARGHGWRSGFELLDAVVEDVFEPYQALLAKLGALDFDDLLGRFVELLRTHPDLAEQYQQRYPWLLVDEFQDTNRVQYDLIRLLVGGDRNVCVVGDPDQSIYRFRGADVRNILEFDRDFPGVRVVRLEQNYRSSKTILRAAEGVIAHNRRRLEKRLFTENEAGAPIRLVHTAGPAQEAREIATRIDRLIGDGTDPEQIAVFYRSHYLSRAIEEGLREFAVPYRVIGGVSFFERREIKDLLAYLRVVVNPIDDVSMERVVNVPPRGIGKVTVDRLRAVAAEHDMSMFEAILEPGCRAVLSSRARTTLGELAALFTDLRALAERGAHAVLKELVERTGYLDYAGGLGDPEDSARVENIGELHNDAALFDEQIGGGLAAYLQHVALMTSEDRNGDDRQARVSLMTVHAAKGLEFDHVFVAGLESGIFPHVRAATEDGDYEEERRLMYVALTRARRELWLGVCRTRMVLGSMQRQVASEFLGEIPRDCLRTSSDVVYPGARVRHDAWDEAPAGAEAHDGVAIEYDHDGDHDVDYDYGQDAVELEPGSRVVHAVYGHGTVSRVNGSGMSAQATIDFDRSGRRILMLEYARLQVVPGGRSR